jgi:hypothetical protein
MMNEVYKEASRYYQTCVFLFFSKCKNKHVSGRDWTKGERLHDEEAREAGIESARSKGEHYRVIYSRRHD